MYFPFSLPEHGRQNSALDCVCVDAKQEITLGDFLKKKFFNFYVLGEGVGEAESRPILLIAHLLLTGTAF